MFRAVPPPATVPLLVAVAGIDDLMKVLVIVFGCLWPILLNTVEGVRAVDPVLADTCRSYGIRGPGRVRSLVLRSASPQIMTGLRQALSVGIILMVISEMFAASNGIGFTVVQFQRTFAVPQMWTGIIVLGLLGVTLAAVVPGRRGPRAALVRGDARRAPGGRLSRTGRAASRRRHGVQVERGPAPRRLGEPADEVAEEALRLRGGPSRRQQLRRQPGVAPHDA